MSMQEAIRARANYSLAVLGMAFVRNGSGRFLNIRAQEGTRYRLKPSALEDTRR